MPKRLHAYLTRDGLGPSLVRALAGSAGIRIVGMALGFFVGIQLARALGPAGYGEYGIAISILSLVTVPVEFGLPFLVTREAALFYRKSDWAGINDVISWASKIIVLTVGIICFFTLLAKYAEFLRLSSTAWLSLMVGLPIMLFVALSNIRSAALRAIDKPIAGQVSELLIRPSLFAALIYMAVQVIDGQISSTMAMSLNTVSTFAAFLCSYILLNANLGTFPPRKIEPETSKRWLKSALPMALTEGLRIGQGHAAILLLGLMSTSSAVGFYRVADAIALACALPISLVNIVCAPVIARLHSAGETARLQRLLKFSAISMTSGVLVLSMPFFFKGAYLLELVFGRQYIDALPIVQIICVGHIVSAAIGLSSTLMNMTGHEKKVTQSLIVALAVNFILSMVLIPRYGGIGAAVANAVAVILWNLLLSIQALWVHRLQTTIIRTSLQSVFCK